MSLVFEFFFKSDHMVRSGLFVTEPFLTYASNKQSWWYAEVEDVARTERSTFFFEKKV